MTTVVQTQTQSTRFGGTTTANSFTSLPAAGNAVICVIRIRASGGYTGVTSVVDNQSGNTYVKVTDAIDTTAGYPDAEVWWCPSIATPSGTFTVTASTATGVANNFLDLIEASGLSGAVDQFQPQTSGGTNVTTVTLTNAGANTYANDLVVAAIYLAFNSGTNGLSNPPTSGYTSLGFNDNGDTCGSAYKIDSGTGQIDAATWSWTSTTLGYGAVITSFKGAQASAAAIAWVV